MHHILRLPTLSTYKEIIVPSNQADIYTSIFETSPLSLRKQERCLPKIRKQARNRQKEVRFGRFDLNGRKYYDAN